MNLARLTLPQRISAIAMLLVALAAFLPWASLFGVSAIGLDGDGVITLVLALAGLVVLGITAGVIGGARTPGRISEVALIVMAALVAIIGIVDLSGIAAIGLYLTLFAGIAWTAAAVWQLFLPKPAPALGPSV